MYISYMSFNVKPEQTQYFIEKVQELAIFARTMPGCLAFRLLQNTGNSHELMLHEEWQDKSYADSFKQTHERLAAVKSLVDTFHGNPTIKEFQV